MRLPRLREFLHDEGCRYLQVALVDLFGKGSDLGSHRTMIGVFAQSEIRQLLLLRWRALAGLFADDRQDRRGNQQVGFGVGRQHTQFPRRGGLF